MKPAMALLALFSAACGGSSRGSSGLPTAPTVPTVVTVPPAQVAGGQLFTYQNAVAFLPAGIAEYKAAIVFLPGLRDPATANDLDSRALAISLYACFSSTRSSASWLPSKEIALDWQRMVKGTVVVGAC